MMHEKRGAVISFTRIRLPLRSLQANRTHIKLIFFLFLWQCKSASALYLQQQQQQQQQPQPPQPAQQQQQQQSPGSTITIKQLQQQPIIAPVTGQSPVDLSNNGAFIQALSQFAAQQASGAQATGAQNQQSAVVVANQTGSAAAAAANGGSGATPNSNQFVIKWIHNDPKNQMAYVSITPVNYTNLHEPRIELRYQSKYPYVSLDERTPNNTVVAAVVVNDEDSGPNGETSLSIEHGNELGHFKLVSTTFTNTIQVNGAPLSKQRNPEYNLTIVARDHGSPPKSSSSNLVIKLQASHYSPSTIASNSISPLESEPSSKSFVTNLMYVGATLVVIFAALVFLIIIGCALVQRPKNKVHKGPQTNTTGRTRSGTSSRAQNHTTDQCSAYCLSLTNMSNTHL